MPSGAISDKFLDYISGKMTVAEAGGYALIDQTIPREWLRPRGVYDVLDPSAVTAGFDRSELNLIHSLILKFGGFTSQGASIFRIADARMIKAQVDYLASAERAFKLRHATSIRCFMHSAARQIGHGDSYGVFSSLAYYIQNILMNGYNGSDVGVGYPANILMGDISAAEQTYAQNQGNESGGDV